MTSAPRDSNVTLRQRFLGGAAWTGSSRVLTNVLSLFVTAIVARLLDPKDFGLLAMATVFSGLADQTQFFGVGSALIQREAVSPENKRAAFTIALSSSLLVYLVLVLSAVPIGWFYKDDRVVPLLRVIALTLPVGAFAVVPRAMLRRNLTLRGEALTNVVVMLSDSTVTIILAWSGAGVWALVIGKVIGAIVTALGLSLASPWRPAIGLRGGDARALLRFGGGLTAANYMWYGYSNFDLMIIGRSLGSSALGVYSMALNLAKMPMERIHIAITPLLLPLYSRARTQPSEIGRVLCRMTRYNALIIFPLAAGLAAVADDAIVVLLGDKWSAAVVPLQLLCFYVLARAVVALVPPALLAFGQVKRILLYNVAGLIILPAGFMVGLQWGPVGVASVWALVYPALALVFLVLPTLKKVEVSFGRYCNSLIRPAVAMIIMVLAVILAGFLPIPAPARLVIRIAIGGVVYLSCIRALEGPIVEEIRLLLRDAKTGLRA